MSKRNIAILVLLLLIALSAGLWQTGFLSPRQPLEQITISTSLSNVTGMLLIAKEKGYFLDNGLEVTLKYVPSGNIGLEQLKAGETDFACFTEFALVSGIFAGGKPLKCLGAIAAAEDAQFIAGKDKGIREPGDAKGKRVGVFRGSNAEFFLARFLSLNGLLLGNIEIIHLNPFAMAKALSDGKVDAVMVWEPVAYEIKGELGDKAVSWPGQGGQAYYWLLVSTDKFLTARAGVAERLIRSLAQAEKYMKSNREESIAQVGAEVKLDPIILKNIWPKYSYELSLHQSLLIAMEDQARWMIQNKLTDRTQVPDYLNYLYPEALLKVNPKAVRVVLPAVGKGH